MFQNQNVETRFGTVRVTATDAQHVHVSAGSSGEKYVTYRGQDYYVSIHLNNYGGKWLPTRDETGKESRTSIHITKSGSFSMEEAPRTYKAAIYEEIHNFVSAFLDSHPAMLIEAEREHVTNALDRTNEELVELQVKVDEARLKRTALAIRLSKLG